MATKLDKNIAGTPVDDELHNSVGAGFNSLDHDTFFGSTDFEIWDTAARGGVQLVENTDYTLHDEDTVLTDETEKTVYTTYKVINPAYQAVDLFFWYLAIGDYNEATDANILRDILSKSDDYTIVDTDRNPIILVTTGAADKTLTWPTIADNIGTLITVVKVDTGAGEVINDGEGAETINGQTTRNLIYQYAKLTGVSDGTEWIIVESRRNLLHIRDEKAQNTPGGTFTQGAWRTRDLNTEKTNEITGALLAANQITLPAGTYYVEWSAPAYIVNNHQTKLYDITNTADLIIGTTEMNSIADAIQTRSFGSGRFTIAIETVIELQHYGEVTNADDGFGYQCNFTTEVYSDIRIWQVS